jgi:hypothetical protein
MFIWYKNKKNHWSVFTLLTKMVKIGLNVVKYGYKWLYVVKHG